MKNIVELLAELISFLCGWLSAVGGFERLSVCMYCAFLVWDFSACLCQVFLLRWVFFW